MLGLRGALSAGAWFCRALLVVGACASVDALAEPVEDGELVGPLAPQLPVYVQYLEGRAWIVDARGAETALREGMLVDDKEGIRTEDSTFVSLVSGDGSRIVLPSSSQVELHWEEEHERLQIMLRQGQVESYVRKQAEDDEHYQVLTPVGVLGVRGTHFRVRIAEGETRSLSEVLEGGVAARRVDDEQSAVLVGARQGLNLLPQGELRPVELLPAPRLLGQGGRDMSSGNWTLLLQPLPGATRYRVQLASDEQFLRIRQERFSEMPSVNFSGLPVDTYHVRLSAFDDNGLEGMTSVYQILYLPAWRRNAP